MRDGAIRLLYLALAIAAMCRAQTGTPVPAFSALDNVMQQALARYGVHGGALAVLKDGRLVFARGYGLGDVEGRQPVQPDSLFRWASISKTVTAAAVMRLVEDGKVDLDTPVLNILNQYSPYNGRWGDSRIAGITVRQLLQHTGGWDRDTSPLLDPVIAEGTVKASQATGAGFPPSLDSVIGYMLAQRLDAAPGSRFAYSNFGYELLGRVIDKVSGQSYESYVRQMLLNPFGLERVQKGSGTLDGRLPDEVRYYDYPGAPLVNSYLSAAREKQPAPYGFWNSDLQRASAEWVGSVVDLAKFVSMLDGARVPALINASSFASMVAQSRPPTWVNSVTWYGLGLFAYPMPGGIVWDHGGYNFGSNSYFYRFPDGAGFAFVFNGATKDGSNPSAYAAQALWDALPPVTEWPDHDLFPRYSRRPSRLRGR